MTDVRSLSWWAPRQVARRDPRPPPRRLRRRPLPVLVALVGRLVWRRRPVVGAPVAGQAPAPGALPPPRGAPVRAHVPQVAMGAGSPLAARRHKPRGWRERAGLGLAGKILVRVDACRHDPRWPLDPEAAAATDQRLAAERPAAVPAGALVGGDRGGSAGCGAMPARPPTGSGSGAGGRRRRLARGRR